MNSKYQTNGALLVGRVVPPRDITTGELLGVLPANRDRFLELARSYRIRSHDDGWFVDGRGHRSQIWEFGTARLGLTVAGSSNFVHKCQRAGDWLLPKSIGDQEANFHCAWTPENLARLTALVGLQRRKVSTPSSRSDGFQSRAGDSEQPN